MSSPESQSSSCSSSAGSPASKQRTLSANSQPDDEPRVHNKLEDGTDEIKIFSASTTLKQEIDDDVDVDGIEDRLSPVVDEPVNFVDMLFVCEQRQQSYVDRSSC
jgi:hypothetical protein